MTLVRHQHGWVIVVSFLVAFILTVVPMTGWLKPFRPDWAALVMIYWCLALPQRVGVGRAWFIGLLLDALTGTLLGQRAMAMALIAYLGVRLHQRIRVQPLWQQAMTVLLLLLLSQLVILWINGIIDRPPPTTLYWLPSVIGSLLWPFVFLSLRALRRKYRVT